MVRVMRVVAYYLRISQVVLGRQSRGNRDPEHVGATTVDAYVDHQSTEFCSVSENVIERRLQHVHLLLERSEEHTSELQSRLHLVCRLLLEKKKSTRLFNLSLLLSRSGMTLHVAALSSLDHILR